jgi:hypothetical protein
MSSLMDLAPSMSKVLTPEAILNMAFIQCAFGFFSSPSGSKSCPKKEREKIFCSFGELDVLSGC